MLSRAWSSPVCQGGRIPNGPPVPAPKMRAYHRPRIAETQRWQRLFRRCEDGRKRHGRPLPARRGCGTLPFSRQRVERADRGLHARKVCRVGHFVRTGVTNDDLASLMETTDSWIVERTGISERRFAKEGRELEMANMPPARP